MIITDITALVERLRELAGQTDAYADNRHHSFVTTQQMGRESAAALTDAADALEALQAENERLRRQVVFTEALRDGALQEAAAAHAAAKYDPTTQPFDEPFHHVETDKP